MLQRAPAIDHDARRAAARPALGRNRQKRRPKRGQDHHAALCDTFLSRSGHLDAAAEFVPGGDMALWIECHYAKPARGQLTRQEQARGLFRHICVGLIGKSKNSGGLASLPDAAKPVQRVRGFVRG